MIATPEELDQFDDTAILAQIPANFLNLVLHQPGTIQLFSSVAANIPGQDVSNVMPLLSTDDQQGLNDLAVLLAGQAIAGIVSCGFAAAVQAGSIGQQLTTLVGSGIVDRVATAIYGIQFLQEIAPSPRTELAAQFAAYVTAASYIAQKREALSTNPVNGMHDVQLITYKLMLLDAASYHQVISVYQKVGLPVFQSVWVGLVDIPAISSSIFPLLQDVAGHVATTITPTGLANGPYMETIVVTTVGSDVSDFIEDELAPLGLTTGVAPNNTTTQVMT